MFRRKKQQINVSTILSFYLFSIGIFSVVIHNAIYGIFGVEEPMFFLLALFSILGFIASVVYNLVTYLSNGKPEDIWKLGWLGLFGLIGIVPQFGPGFYGFFGFFGFFGFKDK